MEVSSSRQCAVRASLSGSDNRWCLRTPGSKLPAGSRHQAPADLDHATVDPAGYLRTRVFSSTGGGSQSHEQVTGTGNPAWVAWRPPLSGGTVGFTARRESLGDGRGRYAATPCLRPDPARVVRMGHPALPTIRVAMSLNRGGAHGRGQVRSVGATGGCDVLPPRGGWRGTRGSGRRSRGGWSGRPRRRGLGDHDAALEAGATAAVHPAG
jgi:hypothetical protein